MKKKLKPIAALALVLSTSASADGFRDINEQIQTYCDQDINRLRALARTELDRHAGIFSELLLSLSPEQRRGLIQAVNASVSLQENDASIKKNRSNYSALESELRENGALTPDAELELLGKLTSLKSEHKVLVETRNAETKAYDEANLDSLIPKNAKDQYSQKFFEMHSPAHSSPGTLTIGYTTAASAQKGDNRRTEVSYDSAVNIEGVEYRIKMKAASYYQLARFSPQFVDVTFAPVHYAWTDRELSWEQRHVYAKASFCRGAKSSVESTQLPTTLPFEGYEEFSRN